MLVCLLFFGSFADVSVERECPRGLDGRYSCLGSLLVNPVLTRVHQERTITNKHKQGCY